MTTFYLPDLGEGLAEADLVTWHVKPGDLVEIDQPVAAVETAKALVDIPAAQQGVIKKFFAKEGETIAIGSALFEFESDNNESQTVVGNLDVGSKVLKSHEDTAGQTSSWPKDSVSTQLKQQAQSAPAVSGERLSASKREMVKSMTLSANSVVPVTVGDDIEWVDAIDAKDILVRTILSIIKALKQEPSLNSWFNGEALTLDKKDSIDIGLAMDTEHGLVVPVLRNAGQYSDDFAGLKEVILDLKQKAHARLLKPDDFKSPTMSVSNFGTYAGAFATPVLVPPQVAIVGIGRMRQAAVVDAKGEIKSGFKLPVSVTVDHRAITGGEVTRFLSLVMKGF